MPPKLNPGQHSSHEGTERGAGIKGFAAMGAIRMRRFRREAPACECWGFGDEPSVCYYAAV